MQYHLFQYKPEVLCKAKWNGAGERAGTEWDIQPSHVTAFSDMNNLSLTQVKFIYFDRDMNII